MRLGHIAIVTADLERTKALYETLGVTAGDVHEVVEQYPEERTPHRYFLSSRGPGFHHLGLKTDDIAGEVRRLNREIRALLSPRDCDGVLIEIVQRREVK